MVKAIQRGMALILMLVIMVLGIAAVLANSFSASALRTARQEKTAAALAQARDALIGYAVTYGNNPDHSGEVHGYLPCPDIDGKNLSSNPAEGSAKPSCGSKNISIIGRLPWKTLGLPALRDGDAECLWYAVSGTYKNNPKTDLMNWDNNGLFEILDTNGATVAQNVVAVVFAPGTVLGNQNRAADGNAPICGGNYTTANYLDSDATINNAVVSGIANAISQLRSDTSLQMNDRMIFITRDDIFNTLKQRSDFYTSLNEMTRKVAECIAGFGRNNNILANLSLPWPAPLALADYGENTSYNDKSGLLAGRVPYQIDSTRPKTGNAIGSNYLFTDSGNNCPASTKWPASYPWWDNWKDHLFYAIGQTFKPDNTPTQSCGSCLKINGTGNYAAIVMFSGEPLSALNQNHSNKSVAGNYLEGSNAANLNFANGNEDYQTAAASGTFNDILYCIQTDLSVAPCP
jgi:type II secretory pathway pseudopilin PulG